MVRKSCLLLPILFFAGLMVLSMAPQVAYAVSASDEEEIQVYRNAGTEKYVKGDYDGAVQELEKAYKIDTGNAKIKEFIVRILVEAGTQRYMKREYPQALPYLEKARTYGLENAKLNDLYRVTLDLHQ